METDINKEFIMRSCWQDVNMSPKSSKRVLDKKEKKLTDLKNAITSTERKIERETEKLEKTKNTLDDKEKKRNILFLEKRKRTY